MNTFHAVYSLSYYVIKQKEYKTDTSQATLSCEEQGSFFKNQLRSLAPPRNTNFYTWTFHGFSRALWKLQNWVKFNFFII